MLNHDKDHTKMKVVLGLWDLARIPYKVGNALLFCNNLSLLKESLGAEKIHIVVVFDERVKLDSKRRITADNVQEYYQSLERFFSEIKNIDSINFSQSTDQTALFPPENYDYKSYLFLNDFNQELKKRATIVFQKKCQERVTRFAKEMCGENFLTIHLKYHESFKITSNAHLEIWSSLLEEISLQYPDLKLVLIGNDLFPENFMQKCRAMRQLIFSRDHSLSLMEELCLISSSRAFIGMASGPSNMAIISPVPYLVFKHKEDAWEENFNQSEMAGDRLRGAGENQLFIVGEENPEQVMNFLKEIK